VVRINKQLNTSVF